MYLYIDRHQAAQPNLNCVEAYCLIFFDFNILAISSDYIYVFIYIVQKNDAKKNLHIIDNLPISQLYRHHVQLFVAIMVQFVLRLIQIRHNILLIPWDVFV